MSILYDIVFLLYCVCYFPYLVLTGRWHREYPQRFGFFPKEIQGQLGFARNIWIHAVSVGEVMVVEGFIHQIKDRWPGTGIVCSVTTKTGFALAQKRLSGLACVIAAPLDFSLVVRRVVRLIRPKLYIAAETEIWPNLFRRLHAEKIPIAIINGRISDRSFGRYQSIRGLLKDVLQKVNIFAMQSELDADRIKGLGAPPERVWVAGNMKFDDVPTAAEAHLHVAGFAPQQPLWIAGSTHPGEEKIILKVFTKLKTRYPSWQLVLAPRHIERTKEVIAAVKQAGYSHLRFSELRAGFDPQAVIVVDTIGHLRGLYAYASLVFVGKSLCVGGGHNVIEPAYYGKPIVVGPWTENFLDIVSIFKDHEALIQVKDEAALEPAIQKLMADEPSRIALGKRARALVDRHQGAGIRTLKLIEQCL